MNVRRKKKSKKVPLTKMNERGDHSGTLYATHMYMCKCIQYMSLYMRKQV